MRESAKTPWELYDVLADPKQQINLVDQEGFRDRVAPLKEAYEAWWERTHVPADDYARPILGSAAEPESLLWAHDWHTEGRVPWNQDLVANAKGDNGFHEVEFARAGAYTFDLRRWPREIEDETTLTSALKTPIISAKGPELTSGIGLPIHSARFRIIADGKILVDDRQELNPDDDGAVFTIDSVPAGPVRIQSWFYDADGDELCGAFYTYVSPAETDLKN
jgi:hypothetical protein